MRYGRYAVPGFLPLSLAPRWAWQFDGLCQKYGGATSEIVRIE
jgi:hypothetical protein